MKQLLLILLVLGSSLPVLGRVPLPNVNYAALFFQSTNAPGAIRKVGTLPATCTAVGSASSSNAVLYQGRVYLCTSTDTWTAVSAGATGADTALSNLASVAINTALLPGSVNAIDLGSTTKWFRDVYLGTSGSFYTKFTVTPTANRVVTFLDATYTTARQDAAQTFTGVQTFSSAPTSPGGGTGSEHWGNGAATNSATNSLAFGTSVAINGNSTIVIGNSSSSGTGSLNTNIGYANAISNGVDGGVLIGANAFITAGSNNVAIGRAASIGHDGVIALGFLATSTAANQFIVGGTNSGLGVTTGYFGDGVVNASPINFTLNGTGGSGTNIAGAMFAVAGGKGTGTGAGGSVKLQTSTALTTGTTLQTLVDRMIVNGANKALTDATNIDLFDATLASNSYTGGTVEATIYASDGTDYQTRTVLLTWQAVNKAGTITSSVTVASETAAVSSGTLTGTWAATNGSGKITIKLSADSSLTPTVFYVRYLVKNNSEQAITIL